MIPERLNIQIEELKTRYLPDCEVKLSKDVEVESSSVPGLFSHSTQVVIEYVGEVKLLAKITPELYLVISADTEQYNIGILKSAANKISESIRSSVLTLSA